eukprot:10315391-Lingulodinium_polyedra.AAC.1
MGGEMGDTRCATPESGHQCGLSTYVVQSQLIVDLLFGLDWAKPAVHINSSGFICAEKSLLTALGLLPPLRL